MSFYKNISLNNKIYIKDYLFIFLILSLSFLISANIAWFNPFPEKHVYKVFERIPFLWQYNKDVPVEILSSTGFFEYFERDPSRIERPGLPLLAYIIGNIFYFLNFGIINLPFIYFTAGSYIFVNFVLHYVSLVFLYKILRIYFSTNISQIGLIIFLFNYITIRHIAEIHTNNMHLLTPVIISYFTINFLKKENLINLFLLSFVFGLLVLIKSLYSFYIAILIFLFFQRKYVQIIQSITIHLSPIIIWLFILKYKNLDFYSATMYGNVPGQEVYMVTWFFQELLNFNFLIIFNEFFVSLKNFLILFLKYYNFLIIFIIMGLFAFLKSKNNQIKKNVFFFSFLIIALSFTQFFLARKSLSHMYMGGDYFLFTLFFILYYLKKLEPKKIVVTIILIFAFLINTINLPYISPYDQKKVDWQNRFKSGSKSLKYFD